MRRSSIPLYSCAAFCSKITNENAFINIWGSTIPMYWRAVKKIKNKYTHEYVGIVDPLVLVLHLELRGGYWDVRRRLNEQSQRMCRVRPPAHLLRQELDLSGGDSVAVVRAIHGAQALSRLWRIGGLVAGDVFPIPTN